MSNKTVSSMKCFFYLFGFLSLPLSAQAASFDCGRAGTKVERMVCDDPEISRLDDELSEVYKTALKYAKKADAIKQAQKRWMGERNACTDRGCVRQAYATQLSLLAGSENVRNENEPRAYYVLMMSEDDSVCKPILAEYNRNILLDLWPQVAPNPYPWPAPPALSLTWKFKPWKSLAENERVLEKTYTLSEADLNGDGKNETIVRWASWLRSDYRSSSLAIFSLDASMPDQMKTYEQFRFKNSKADVVPGGYDFPKLKGKAAPEELNDFDVIQFNGKQYVTGKSVDMDGIVEVHIDPQWRIVSRVRYGKPITHPESDLDWVLDSVCYFKLKITK